MIRPWMGAVAVALGLAALPGVAAAQDAPPADTTNPVVRIDAPLDGATFTQGQPVAVAFACNDDGGSGLADCSGTSANGGLLDTSTPGSYTFTATARDGAGNLGSAHSAYTVIPADSGPGTVGGTTAATLTLTLGTPTPFAPFTPGLGSSYSMDLVATVLSTAANATLSVADPSTTATGHLVNGALPLPQALQAGATSHNVRATAAAPAAVGGAGAPTTLLTYSGPVTNDPATLTFTQAIGATDALRTGTYAKSLTFTLSTSSP
jgi:hypothetical protein